jgi:3-dehydroquinate synthase
VRTAALTLRHATGDCPIFIGSGAIAELPELTAALLPGRRLAIISDNQVAASVPAPLDAPVLTFPAGEPSKTRDTWARLTDELLALGVGRDGAIVAVGGGVTGDLAGFVAATYLRGIPFVQVPTSLLAMLDASIGGKTGVDVPAGKNLVGAFHQPAAVVVDPRVLRSLPEREYRSGLAEAVKHAAIADAEHFAWLRAQAEALIARDEAALDALLRRSIAIKAAVVMEDEREGGRRAVLNAGHTVAHAVEAASGYAVLHGEAVAIGMVAEARLGEALGVTAAGTAGALADLLEALALPTLLPGDLSRDAVIAAMQADKKNRGRDIRFALLKAVGVTEAPWTMAAAPAAILAALQ